MKKLKVTKVDSSIEENVFQDQAGVDAYVLEKREMGIRCPWGRPSYDELVSILDGDGNPVLDVNGDPTYNVVPHDDEFTIEVTDVTQEYQLSDAIANLKVARAFGVNLVDTFAIENVVLGINDAQSDAVLAVLSPALSALTNGYLETAIRRVKELDQSGWDGVFLSEARLLGYVNRIETFLGITLSTSLGEN